MLVGSLLSAISIALLGAHALALTNGRILGPAHGAAGSSAGAGSGAASGPMSEVDAPDFAQRIRAAQVRAQMVALELPDDLIDRVSAYQVR